MYCSDVGILFAGYGTPVYGRFREAVFGPGVYAGLTGQETQQQSLESCCHARLRASFSEGMQDEPQLL